MSAPDSYYMPPNMSQVNFEAVLDQLISDAKDPAMTPVVIAGDFNVWAVKWGSEKTNK